MANTESSDLFSTLKNTSSEFLKFSQGDESLILKLDLGPTTQNLIIHENDHPEEAVIKFCSEHNLSQEIAKLLLTKVLENIPLEKQPITNRIKNQTKFIKKGNFIKKEVPLRGRSAIRFGTCLSPSKNSEKQEKFHQSPIVRNKFKLDPGTKFLPKPKQQSNRM